MDDYSALAYRIAGSVADVRGCLILSRDGLILGSYPDDETAVKPAWMRFASLGDPERSFVEFGDQVWVYVRRPAYGAFAVADSGVRPGLVIDQLEQILLSAEEARTRRETLRVPEASGAPSGKPRTSLHPPADRPDPLGAQAAGAAAPATAETRPWARGDANMLKRRSGGEDGAELPDMSAFAGVSDDVGRTGDAAADVEAVAAPETSDGAEPSRNGKAGGKKESKKSEKDHATTPPPAAGGGDPANDDAERSTNEAEAATRPEDGAEPAAVGAKRDAPAMEMDADAEVDPVLLAKEFSGLLQVESGDDEGTS